MTRRPARKSRRARGRPRPASRCRSRRSARGARARSCGFLRNQTALILLIVLIIAGGLLSDVFLTSRNLLNIMWAVSILGIIALGQTMLLITCNFDMSVAFVVGLAGIITVLAQIAGFDLVTSMALGLGGGRRGRSDQRPARRLYGRQSLSDNARHGAARLFGVADADAVADALCDHSRIQYSRPRPPVRRGPLFGGAGHRAGARARVHLPADRSSAVRSTSSG